MEMSDQELLVKLYAYAGQMSYYNAAEGVQWGIEAEARGKCALDFEQLKKEAVARGLELDLSKFLL